MFYVLETNRGVKRVVKKNGEPLQFESKKEALKFTGFIRRFTIVESKPPVPKTKRLTYWETVRYA